MMRLLVCIVKNANKYWAFRGMVKQSLPLEPTGGPNLAYILVLCFQPPALGDDELLVFKPP